MGDVGRGVGGDGDGGWEERDEEDEKGWKERRWGGSGLNWMEENLRDNPSRLDLEFDLAGEKENVNASLQPRGTNRFPPKDLPRRCSS